MSTKVKGTIKSISDIITVTDKFSKVEMVIETSEDYPQTLMTEWPNDSASIPKNFSVGDVVEAAVNIRGRAWTSPSGDVKYFTSLSGWTCDLISPASGKTNSVKVDSNGRAKSSDDDDDLPF